MTSDKINEILKGVSKKIETVLKNKPLLILFYINFDIQNTKNLTIEIYPRDAFWSYYEKEYKKIIEKVEKGLDTEKAEKIKFHNIALNSGWDYLGIKFCNSDISIVSIDKLESENIVNPKKKNLEEVKEILIDHDKKVLEKDEAEKFGLYITMHSDLLKNKFVEETDEIYYHFFPFKCAENLASAVSFFIKGNDPWTKDVEKLDRLRKEIFFDTSSFATGLYLEKIRDQNLKIAVVTILVDSYAHNISAHSLSYLEWWFKLRGSELEQKWYMNNEENLGNIRPKSTDINKDLIRKISNISYERYCKPQGLESLSDENIFSLLDILNYMPKNIEREFLSLDKKFKQRKNQCKKDEENPGFPVPIDHVMWRFLKYLQCKAAFWSGVTREKTFGGEIKNLYSVLWEDFANNPLFLGTIAASEGIFKIGIYIQLKNSDGGTILEGEFVEIDLSIVSQIANNTKKNSINHEEENISNEVPQNGSIYNFVKLKEDFQKLKEKLVELKVFFPGGVVGEHAFFTILENTLRNVKHIDKDDLKDIMNDRLQLYISLMDYGKIIKVGIWLNHPVALIDEKSKKPVIFRLKNMLESQIVDEKGTPILGGTSQDKICASMLYVIIKIIS